MPKRNVGKDRQKITDEQLAMIKDRSKNLDRLRRSARFEEVGRNGLSLMGKSGNDINSQSSSDE